VFDPLGDGRGLPENRIRVYTVQADLSKPHAVSRVIQQVLSHFGRIDLVIHAAGYRRWAHLSNDPRLLENFRRHFWVNVRAPLLVSLEIARLFWSQRPRENREANRNVITIGSTAGLRVYPGYGQAIYAASKAAALHLTNHLAAELGPMCVRANVIAPDTFPRIIPTDWVTKAIARLDAGTFTGRTLMLERQGETWI
jgi:NAD(P)-dependent dehydrogenase (short-subunit alcohol dehydrogenase family)